MDSGTGRAVLKGFTLLELMIVVAIIGVLAAVAIPSYQDYLARSQASEAVTLTASGKAPLAEYLYSKGTWPSSASDVMGTTSGRYVSALTITAGGASTSAVALTAIMKGADISPGIMNKSLVVTSSDGKSWDCRGGTIEAKFRPAACR